MGHRSGPAGFLFQNLAVQTHIHHRFTRSGKGPDGWRHKAPLKLDPIDQCRLCQELVHAGPFLAPSAVVSLLSLAFVAVSIARALTFAADPATAFAWRAAAHRAAESLSPFCARPKGRLSTPWRALSHFGVSYVSFPFSFWRGRERAAFRARLRPASRDQSTESVTVTAEKLAAARNGIQTQTGASTYTVTAKDIQTQPGGDNAQLNSVVLQMPGVAQDSFGQLHIRGEHNGLQYRLNGIILPEGISVFGQTLDPRLAESVRLITGALPAEYGLRTAGIVDIQTKSGVFEDGGVVSMYGGSHSTLSPSVAYGGSSGHFNYFVSGDYTTNTLGIESPDGSSDPRHDRTQQYHGFAFLQDILDQNSSVSAVLGTSNAIFQIPNQRGLQPTGLDGIVGLGPQDPGSGNFVLNANGAPPSRRTSGRTPARDHPLRHPELSALGGLAGLSGLGFRPLFQPVLHARQQCRRHSV